MEGAVVYTRVSTKEQTENLSLPTQLKFCRQYCERQGFHVVKEFVEQGESAKTTERPELQQLLSFCRDNKSRVCAVVGLIRFGGHLPKGEYDVDHGGHEGQAGAAELHG